MEMDGPECKEFDENVKQFARCLADRYQDNKTLFFKMFSDFVTFNVKCYRFTDDVDCFSNDRQSDGRMDRTT